MSRKLSFSLDDESGDLVQRYEQFLSGKANGYFDVEELENIVEYYLRRGRTKDCNKAIDYLVLVYRIIIIVINKINHE